MRLSRHVRLNPQAIDSSLQRLNCVSQGITEVDIHPTVLSLLTSVAPDVVRQAVAEMPSHDAGDSTKADQLNFSGAGLNTALAFSLHTVLLSRNRITTTLGILQFKNTVRLSLLGNKLQRIEDCEALSLLPSLQYLSLEFNPVTSLPHYRPHILRICSWPEILHPKNCRLRKLDTRHVVPAEVERAAQCLHREIVTIGELVHRMRFLALLTEAERRIALHHELRRRGLLLQDIIIGLTVENVVTRCSAQLLALVSVSTASHMVRRLMSGKCRMCSTTTETLSVDKAQSTVETSPEASSLSHSLCGSNVLSLQNPHKASIAAFCKDWSRDIFRHSITSLDHSICGLLLSIAHALGEELTVMDVDHLNKLWLLQVRKVDRSNFYHRENYAKTLIVHDGGKLLQSEKKNVNSATQEELVHITLMPSDAPCGNDVYTNSDNDQEVVSPSNISSISERVTRHGSILDVKSSHELTHDMLEHSPHKVPQLHVISVGQEHISDTALVEPLPQPLDAPVPFPSPTKGEASVQMLLVALNHRTMERIMRDWRKKTWRKRQDVICRKYIEKKVSRLLTTESPQLYAICSTFHFLQRTERKRVLFQFWRREAWASYAPKSFRTRSLLARWRWRMYDEAKISFFSAESRVRVLRAMWRLWYVAFREKSTLAQRRGVEVHGKHIEDVDGGVSVFRSAAYGTPICRASTPVNLCKQSRLSLMRTWSKSKVETEATEGLTCSAKPSVEDASGVGFVLPSEKSPEFATHPLSPMTTPVSVISPPVRHPVLCEKATQASAQLSHDTLSVEYKATVRAELEDAVQLMQADRSRLIDRLIELEQRANEEAVCVRQRDEEIAALKRNLSAMTVREECVKSTLGDYQRELEHLRNVVQALRDERRELLRTIVH